MIFNQDRFVERGQTGASQKSETAIQSNNFGGLNTLASPLNCPFEDSPELKNIEVDISGNLIKRKGTKLIYWNKTIGQGKGVSVIPFTTGLGYNFLIHKQAKDLHIHEVINDTSTVVITKTNVWNSLAEDVRVNYVSTNEVEPRLIMCTGVNVPVQLKFVEQQQVVTGSPSTSIVITNASRFENATTSNLLVFRDRVKQTFSGVSYNTSTKELTITGLSSFTGTYTFDVILITWQWWAEAYFYYGDRFYDTATRFNVTTTDQNVEIPANLRDSISPMSPSFPRLYPIAAFKNSVFNNSYTFKSTANPATWDEFAHSDGSRYSSATGGTVNTSPFFLTFGTTFGSICAASGDNPGAGSTNCNPQSVHMSRRRFIPFNGGRGWLGSNVKVYVNNSQKSQNVSVSTPGAYEDWYAWNIDLSGRVTSTSTISYGIDFTAGDPIGIKSDAAIEIVNTEVKFVGSGANPNRDSYSDGNWVPAFGLGDFANYGSGSFPGNVALYQGRLVFSGFPEQSLRVVFSNQYDSLIPGRFFNDFQIDSTKTKTTDPFDLVLNSTPDDLTKGMVEWQQSLFVLTRKAVFRIAGAGGNAISNTSKVNILVSNIGLINSYCVVKTDKSILYLSDTGVFDLSTNVDSTEYVAGEKSLKIRSKFGITSDPTYEPLPWMSFDTVKKVVYLGYPEKNLTETCYRLYVYNTFRESWTEYYTPGGFNTWVGTPYVDRQNGYGFLLALHIYRSTTTGLSLDTAFVRTEYNRYIDYAQTFTGTGSATNYEIPQRQRYELTTTEHVREYAFLRERTLYAFGYESIPVNNINDLCVYLETAPSSGTFQVLPPSSYVKLPNGNIYLLDNPGSGKKLRIEERLPVTDSEEGRETYDVSSSLSSCENIIVFRDNVFIQNNGVNYTINNGGSFGGTCRRINYTAPNNSVLIIGQAYPTYYLSPLFTQEILSNLKRNKYLFVFFDNSNGQDTFLVSDVNTAAGQTAEELAGVPKQRLNVNLGIRYESENNSENYFDSYGFSQLMWDNAYFDIDSPSGAYPKYILFKQPLQGIGYSYQFLVWNFDETTFILGGYQIVSNQKGNRYISKFL